MEQPIIYRFPKAVQRAKERYRLLAVMLPAMFLVFLFLSPAARSASLPSNVGIGLFLLVVLGLVFYFTASTTLRKLSELSISIFPDRLERESRNNRETFLWKDVRQVDILEYPDGVIASINLALAGRRISLFGLEDMAAAAKQIEERIPRETPVRRKRMKVNWDQPIYSILGGILAVAGILGLQAIGQNIYRLFNAFLTTAFAVFLLAGRPISRAQGMGWRKFELIIGILLIVSAAVILFVELFLIFTE